MSFREIARFYLFYTITIAPPVPVVAASNNRCILPCKNNCKCRHARRVVGAAALPSACSNQSSPTTSRTELGCRGRTFEVRLRTKAEAPAEIPNAITLKTGPAHSNDEGVYTWSAALNIQTSKRPTVIDSAAETSLRPLRTYR